MNATTYCHMAMLLNAKQTIMYTCAHACVYKYIYIYMLYSAYIHIFFMFCFHLRSSILTTRGKKPQPLPVNWNVLKHLLIPSFRHLVFFAPHANPFKIFIAMLSTLGLSHFMQCCAKQSNYRPPEWYWVLYPLVSIRQNSLCHNWWAH